MIAFLQRVFRTRQAAAIGEEAQLENERQLRSLHLELEERDKLIAQFKRELQRVGDQAKEQVEAEASLQMEGLMKAAAAPVAQLLAQRHLVEMENKPVQTRDVLVVAQRLIRALEEEGLVIEGKPGANVVFDPNTHEPFSAETRLAQGQTAVLKFVGISFRGRLLRKAGVTQPAPPLPAT
jgi:hypothetical protein